MAEFCLRCRTGRSVNPLAADPLKWLCGECAKDGFLRRATDREADEIWAEAKAWFADHGSRFSSVGSTATTAVAEYIANQRWLSLWEP